MNIENSRLVTLILSLVGIGLLLYGIPKGLAYDYYVFMRWAVMGIAAFFAYISFEKDAQVWAWLMVAVGFLFNPIIPFHMSKDTWVVADIITAILLGTTIFVLNKRSGQND